MNRTSLVALLSVALVACSRTNDQSASPQSTGAFAALPASSSERVVLTGQMSFWMYEGDAGCYGAITNGSTEVQLWIDAESCGEKDYQENETASVEVTFKPDNQYGPGKTFTITSFK